ncbi:MAG: response regulator [Candidatus Eisenbacteria bacterium]|uniref:histidine kinase n=1 Tax=Eiseniibacteriota bacterium TaxID=2212470 RepID=A0A538TMT2_UNCEI|nr:MAG: response regulator [Candidatus Eisenbacteria bacterium]
MSDAVERPLQIVHLEDDPNDKLIVRATLKQQGVHCEVASVSTKDEFVRALERADIDLILSDYGLPGFDGLSALAIASRVQPNTPFILVSGTMGEEAAIESLRGGATDYVLKSRLTRLAPAVRRAVEEANERKTRHQTEVTLERERKFLRALLDSLDAGVVACDQDGTLTLFNRATRELHGLEEQSIPPEQWASQYKLYQADGETPLTTEEIPLHRALQGEHLRHAEITIRHREGAAHVMVVSGQPIIDDGGEKLGAVITMRDVTELKQLERQFQQAQKMEAMGLLAAGVAHDFNNLLTVISGYCQLAQARLQAGHPVLRDLAEVVKAGERAANLTRQLLAFSRQQVLEPRVLDLNEVIEGVEKMLSRLLGADIDLRFRPAEGLGQLRADAGQVEQVLLNLIVNARDAMPDGGRITIETENVEIRDRSEIPSGSYVLLTVSDTGSGMDAKTSSRIFEPFFTTKELGRGTGLGLSTVHGIVKQSEGHIAVQSELGQGTTFRIHFPRVSAGQEVSKSTASHAQPARGTEAILVVDDDASLRGLVSEILRLHGYTVVEANNGEMALTMLENDGSVIDAVVTDVVMPNLNGRELARRVAKIRPNLPMLLMSGYVGKNVEALGSLLGPRVAFIQKPFNADALLEKLRDVLKASATGIA